jgi:hypothetical protein
MMTLSEAQAAVAEACRGHWRITADLVEWNAPQEDLATWVDIVGDESALGHDVTVAKAIVAALVAYSAHLSFEAGQAFELAAVRRAAQSGVGADDAMDGDAFLRFDEALANGYHHAEPKGQ